MPITRILAALVALFACSALALSACGNPPKKDVGAKGGKATAQQSLQEIDVVRKDLIRVADKLRTGNRKAAGEIVAETYVQHFEKVEQALRKADGKLETRLEQGLSRTLRQMIKSGKPKARIQKYITQLDAGLGQAQDKLKKQ
jgi:hypothetical protein